MAAKMAGKQFLGKVAKIENFSPLHRIPFHYPASQNFSQICSLSLKVSDIFNFIISGKIQDDRQNFQILNFFVFKQDNLLLPIGMKICSKSLYL